MIPLNRMDSLERGILLCKLFPEELKNIQGVIKKQCDYFLENEIKLRENWHNAEFLTADFWYTLVRNANQSIERNEGKLWKKPKWFADHFFDGYNSLFAKHCLIEYANGDDCNTNLKDAIYLFFGREPLLEITHTK
ncbi:hypothetical protein [Elizabethkingia anophelis]|uniref:hypothetical protein n=1 Tax=Elizabethkingia anophelis TaxID=1117645 RepID=UPI00046341E5|nr:hypothetical protein [Elizabethkingia anophelis]